jgi:SAM-dependent methyltransferase
MQSPVIFDRRLLRERRRRAAALEPADFLLARVAEELKERLASVLRHFDVAVDLGTPGDHLRDALAASGKVGTVIAADPLANFSLPRLRGRVGEGEATVADVPVSPHPARDARRPPPQAGEVKIEIVAADEEALPFRDGSLDLVVSALALHFVNDLPGALVQIRRALKPDGLFLAALFGGETLTELRRAFAEAEVEVEGGISPRVVPFPDLRDLGALLQRAGFALPVADIERVTVRYATVFALMHDLRGMGATNALNERRRLPLRRSTLMRMAEIYARRFADPDGRLRATFEIVWLSGWTPDASQQQPLQPGSAKMRLADALGTVEFPAGEKPPR